MDILGPRMCPASSMTKLKAHRVAGRGREARTPGQAAGLPADPEPPPPAPPPNQGASTPPTPSDTH